MGNVPLALSGGRAAMGGRKELGQGLLMPVQNLLRARLSVSCFPISATSTNSFLLGRAQGELCTQ